MQTRRSKGRTSRKRLDETVRHARPARRGGRMTRVVKTRGVVLARPANDTGLPPDAVEALVLAPDLVAANLQAEALAADEETEAGPAVDAAVESTVEAEADADAEQEGEDSDDEPEVAVAAPPTKRASHDEPGNFLAMYFRDMAQLDVLKPAEEFDTARRIEEMELDLWQTILGFAPGADWMTETVDRAVGKPTAEGRRYRRTAERARKCASIPERARFDRSVKAFASRLRAIDIDRLYLDAAIEEVRRVGRGVEGLPFEGSVRFSVRTKVFREYVRTVVGKAFRLKAAKNEFVKANLRLVVSIARRFNHGRLPLADLIQEGNIGLMKAVERYDYRRGFRFSTYASWWIRHAISRALADKGRAVRLPVHMIDAYHRIGKATRELTSRLERAPTTAELAEATGIEADKLEKMKTFLAEAPVSLDRPISDEDGRKLVDVLADPNEGPSVPERIETTETQGEMLRLLGGLKPIEADILRKRFGLGDDREQTLKEIGDEYHLSRERVRQLQEQALGKMRRAMAKREMA